TRSSSTPTRITGNCGICQIGDDEDPMTVIKLRCGHTFCESCLNSTMNSTITNSDKCPSCRAPIRFFGRSKKQNRNRNRSKKMKKRRYRSNRSRAISC
ncbi:MAG: zinc-RING finger domain, partial [Bacteroidota bacterium]